MTSTESIAFAKKTWRQELSEAFTDLGELCRFLEIRPEQLNLSDAASQAFAFRVPRSFAARIKKNSPNDPLLKQVLPTLSETDYFPDYSDNPVGDLEAIATPGVIHKYHGRVLLIATGHCAINCRYCFRKTFPYDEQYLGRQKLQTAIAYIASDSSISEVILSGGDPLTLSDARLNEIFYQLGKIDHVKRIRLHSRIPVVLPTRFTDVLIDVLTQTDKDLIVVLHSNHSQEIDDQVAGACNLLNKSGITLLNQAVLLQGINDSVTELCRLSETLFSAGVLPYYLHLLDKVTGTRHFAVDQDSAIELIDMVKQRLPGYLVPKLVVEHAGAPAKVAVTGINRFD